MSVTGDDAESPLKWTVDDLAGRAGLPVRTIREYQTIGLLPPPRKRGRVGLYSRAHLARLHADRQAPGTGVLPGRDR